MTIILYDIPTLLPGKALSPNVWKTRYCLNYKGIPYRTEWVEFPDIEPHCKTLGIEPTGKKADGSDYYTLPAIHDSSTGTYVSDSFRIAEYLDKTYPSTPPILPFNTVGLQTVFLSAFSGCLAGLPGFILPTQPPLLNPPSREYFIRTNFNRTEEQDIMPQGKEAVEQWAKFKAGMGRADAWYAKLDEGDGKKTQFLMGDALSFADLFVAGFLIWLRKSWGEESEKWQDMLTWDGGRWRGLLESLQRYETIL